MFGNFHSGHHARNNHDSANSSWLIGLADARLVARMLAASERRQTADPPDLVRRPHRGMLPDVDMSMLVPDPNHRPLARRIVDAVRKLAGQSSKTGAAAMTMSAGGDKSVAEAPPSSYIR